VPFLAPIFAAAASAVGAIGTAIVSATTFGALSLGFSFGTAGALGVAALGAATVGTLGLLTPHPNLGGATQIQFAADKTAGVPYLIGRTGTAGNIVFIDTSNDGHNKWIHYFVVFSTGPVDSFQSFTANQTAVSFSAGAATTSPYNGKMWLATQVGVQPSSLLTAPSGTGTVPEWTSNHKLSGLAAARWVMQSDQKTYPAGSPQPLWVWKGAKVYDPRLDSTYPGGSGSQRSGTPSTWAWSENPYLHALTWCLGQTSNGIRTVGLGVPVSAIDVAAFVTGANVADANGWKCGGVVNSQNSKWDVLTAMLQAGGGTPVRQGNQISCMVSTPLVSVVTLTGADVVGEAQINGSQPRRTRINSVTPKYRSEAHSWDQVDADPVTISAYVTADGQKRSKEITWELVQDVNQVSQLAYYYITDAREFGPVVLPLKTRWNGLRPGDAITLNENELGMSSQKLVILSRQRDPATGLPTFTLRSETDAKHAAALALSGTAPPTPSLSAIDLVNVPAPGAGVWSAAGGTLAVGNQQVSVLVVTGTVDNPNASAVIVEYSVASAGVWQQVTAAAQPGTMIVNIPGVIPATAYDVRVSYVQRGNPGATATPTGSPATTGAGATYNAVIASKTAINPGLGGVTLAVNPTWTDVISCHVGTIPTGGQWQVWADINGYSGNQGGGFSGTLGCRIVVRDHAGGTNPQVIDATPTLVTPSGSYAVLTDSTVYYAAVFANPGAASVGDVDVVLQMRPDSAGGTPSVGNRGVSNLVANYFL
jgi:hypothetical protein